MVDFGRMPYRTRCRFLRDSDLISRVRWIEVPYKTPTLDRTCVIYRREWDNDQWNEVPVGELPDERKRFSARFLPRGLPGVHVCGTDRDFDEGGHYDPTLPPVDYSTSGFPRCCDPPVGVFGGAAAGGKNRPTVISPAVCEEITTGCSEALAGPLNHTCPYFVSEGLSWWARWTPGTFKNCRLTFTRDNAPTSVDWVIHGGLNCSSLSTYASGTLATGTLVVDFTTGSFPDVWFNFQSGGFSLFHLTTKLEVL